MAVSKNGKTLDSLDEWEKYAGPKRPCQWVDGRSAKELSKIWIGNRIPSEVAAILQDHARFGHIENWNAEPEAKLKFDTFRGETCNCDLAVWVQDPHDPFLIAIEAKADEEFGTTIAKSMATALEKRIQNPRSEKLNRIESLAKTLLHPQSINLPSVGELHYQLFTVCAGALCEAERRQYSRAVVLIHEFITPKTSDGKHKRNSTDLNKFLCRLSNGKQATAEHGKLYGPFVVPGEPLIRSKIDLFIGKVSRNLRTC